MVGYTCNGILRSNKKESAFDGHSDTEEFQNNYAD